MIKSLRHHPSPHLIWFLGAIFFFFDYIIRVAPSILTPLLMQFFHANAFTIGGFSAFFYYAYIGMQIPVGILVDKFGPKWLLIMSAMICAISTFMFAEMNSITLGFFSRFLMGFGASFAFVGTLKLISVWFKAERFAFFAGLTQALGMVGAMVGQGPMAKVYQSMGWRPSMYGLGIIFLIISLCMLLFIKEKHHEKRLSNDGSKVHNVHIMKSLQLVLTSSQNWLNCLFIGLLYAPSACFGEQWGASFLSLNQGISMEAAGHETGMMFIGLAIGCPVLGWISDKLQRRLLVMRVSVVACCLLLSVVIYGPLLPGLPSLHPSTYTLLLFVYGFFNSGIVCSYALASEINPPELTGMALGITNMASVIIGAMMIPTVGYILDTFSTGIVDGVHTFGLEGYQMAFAALPVGFMIAFVMSFFQKETYCQRLH
jgi:MFS family permease